MTRFQFMLIGGCERLVLEIAVASVTDLLEYLTRAKFVEGRLVQVDGHGDDRQVIIPVSRIQTIVEIAN